MRTWLVDTGPFVAYVDRADPSHRAVAAALDSFRGQLVTSGAVITEVMYFLADVSGGPRTFAALLAESRTRIAEVSDLKQISNAAALMEKYADTPMDFADATLVLLGEQLGVSDVLTLDRRGFSIYRTAKSRPFSLVLDL